MVSQMDLESFGHCTLYGECQEACPKEISIDVISRMNRDFLRAAVTAPGERRGGGDG
jgi:succinate dehydrogenase / fumarate reductase, iron-sulfur subunit